MELLSFLLWSLLIGVQVFVFSAFFWMVGLVLWTLLLPKKISSDPLTGINLSELNILKHGASFYIGALLFVASWKLLAHIGLSAKLSLCATIVLMNMTLLRQREKIQGECTKILKQHLIKGVCLLAVVSILIVIRSLDPLYYSEFKDLDFVNPFHGIGYAVSHTFRSGNIASWIWQHDSLPFLKQHIAQSMLGATSLIIFSRGTILNILIWMASFQIFFAIFTYGLIDRLVTDQKQKWIAWFVATFGATLPGYYLNFVTDIASINFLINSLEAILGITSFSILLLVLFQESEDSWRDKSFIVRSFILFLIGYSWSLCATQNMVLFFCLMVLGVLLSYLIKNKFLLRLKSLRTLILSSFLGVGCILGTFEGGIFYRGQLRPSDIPGAMAVQLEGGRGVQVIWPFVPHKYHHSFQIKKYLRAYMESSPSRSELLKKYQESGSWWKKLILWSEAERRFEVDDPGNYFDTENSFKDFLWTVPKSIFYLIFPLMGWYWVFRSKKLLNEELGGVFVYTGFMLFLGGGAICSSVSIDGYRFEMTRFFYLGLYFSMIMFGLAMGELCTASRYLWQRRIWMAIALSAVFGPLMYVSTIVGINIRESIKPKVDALNFKDKANLLINLTTIVGTKSDKR